MIASLTGVVASVGLDRLVVEVGGVGMLLYATPGTAAAARVGEQVSVATSLVVREDSLTLYAFRDADERDTFETAMSVSGIGPRLALAMLAVMSPEQLRAAVASADHAALVKIPGVGKKSAERLVLELRDRLDPPLADAGRPAANAAVEPWREQVIDALVGLGWNAKQAAEAVDAVTPASGEPGELAAILRAALRELGR